MNLTLITIVRMDPRTRSYKDQRVMITRTIAEYRGDDGETYRKAFEARGTPVVPETGTHHSLNGLQYQWCS